MIVVIVVVGAAVIAVVRESTEAVWKRSRSVSEECAAEMQQSGAFPLLGYIKPHRGTHTVRYTHRGTYISPVSSNHFCLETGVHRQSSKKDRGHSHDKRLTVWIVQHHALLQRLGLHRWLGTQIDFVRSHYEQSTKFISVEAQPNSNTKKWLL